MNVVSVCAKVTPSRLIVAVGPKVKGPTLLTCDRFYSNGSVGIYGEGTLNPGEIIVFARRIPRRWSCSGSINYQLIDCVIRAIIIDGSCAVQSCTCINRGTRRRQSGVIENNHGISV